MRVDVPADWGYGGAPQEGTPETVACGAVAMVSATGERLPRRTRPMPYVGRPIAQTDLCQVYPWIGPNDVPRRRRTCGSAPPSSPGRWTWVTAGCRRPSTSTAAGSRSRRGTPGCGSGSSTPPAAGRPACPRSTPGARRSHGSAGRRRRRTPTRSRSAPTAPRRVPPRVPRQGSSTPRVSTGRPSVTTSPPSVRRRSGGPVPDADVVEAEWVVLELGDSDGTVVRRDIVHLACPGIDVDGSDARRLPARRADTRAGRALGRRWGPGGALRPDRRQGGDDRLVHRPAGLSASARPASG